MKKRMSWAAAGLILLLMTALQFVLDLGFSSTFRNEVGSIHSDFWLIIVPSDLVANTILAVAMRFVYNRLTCKDRAGSQGHQIERG